MTNLLALSAAIEAARADDHDQGCAVVADHLNPMAAEKETQEPAMNACKVGKSGKPHRPP